MQDQLIKDDLYKRENPFTGWNLKIDFKSHGAPQIPKIKTLDTIGTAQKYNFLPRRKY